MSNILIPLFSISAGNMPVFTLSGLLAGVLGQIRHIFRRFLAVFAETAPFFTNTALFSPKQRRSLPKQRCFRRNSAVLYQLNAVFAKTTLFFTNTALFSPKQRCSLPIQPCFRQNNAVFAKSTLLWVQNNNSWSESFPSLYRVRLFRRGGRPGFTGLIPL